MFQEDLDMEHEATRIAGNSLLLKGVPKYQQRIAGLADTKILRRLDYFDFANPNRNLSSNVFNISRSRFDAAFSNVKPAIEFEGFWRDTLLRPHYERTYRKDVFKELKSSHGGSYRPYADYGKKALAREAATPAEERKFAGFAIESNPLQTRQEMVAHIAGIDDPKQISRKFDFTLAQKRAFVDLHEFQHGRSVQIWAEDPAFLDATKVPPIAEEYPEYKPLWQKTSQASKLSDLYIAYLEEDMSDTAAILNCLKAGAADDLCEVVADARAIAHLNEPSEKYASYIVLDEISKDIDGVRARVIGKSPEEIDRMAAKLVGTFAMDRDVFYAQAMAGGLHMANEGREENDRHLEKLGQDIVDDHLNAWKPIDYNTAHELSLERLNLMLEREDLAYDRLCVRDAELTYEDHKAEVLATIRHAQDMHPEFAGATGGKYLLAARQRMLKVAFDTEMDDDIEINQELSQYLDDQHIDQHPTKDLSRERA